MLALTQTSSLFGSDKISVFDELVLWYNSVVGHLQEILFAGIGKCILKIDMAKVGKGETQPASEPVKCHHVKLMEGVQLVGKHEGEVTDLSVCHWMTSRLVSASTDGMVIYFCINR